MSELFQLEAVAANPDRDYIERGLALAQIVIPPSIAPQTEEYCRQRFGFSADRAEQLIAAAKVASKLRESGAVLLPLTEHHARPLVGLPADRLVETWAFISTTSKTPIPISEYIQAVADTVKRAPGAPLRFATLDSLPDSLWPSDNILDIPSLVLDLAAKSAPAPILAYGARARAAAGVGTYHFYVDDSRFAGLISDPTPVVNAGAVACCEPNFSIYGQLPRVLALGRIYHKRAIARYWQSEGIGIFVDLNVAREFYSDNLLGVPDGWPSWSTRGYSDRLNDLEHEYQIARQHADRPDVLFLVYGGGRAVTDLCDARGWLWVPEQANQARRVQ